MAFILCVKAHTPVGSFYGGINGHESYESAAAQREVYATAIIEGAGIGVMQLVDGEMVHVIPAELVAKSAFTFTIKESE
jgi:hypothetical protein